MNMPSAYWQMTYSASRRKHSHRCWTCRKIICEGDDALMARVQGKATRCMHTHCADRVSFAGHRGRDFLEYWGMEYLAACGWKAAKDFLDSSPLARAA